MRVSQYTTEIIDMYTNQGLDSVQIANHFGCDNTTIGRILKKNGITLYHTPNEIQLSNDERMEIINAYQAGATTIELSKKYHVADATIAKIIRQENGVIRRAARRSKVSRHDYFHVIDTVDKAYFLGWMISDGAVINSHTRQNRAPVISLEIHSDDDQILYMFARAIGAPDSIVHKNTKRNHCYMRFASQQMADDLAQYGVVNCKSNITYLPKLDRQYMSHLLRGIFDGDGTATVDADGHTHFAFYGSYQICQDIAEYLHETLGLNQNKVSKSTCHHVWWGGNNIAKKFAGFLYQNCSEYFLARKRNKFPSYQENTEVTCQIA